MLSSEQQGRRDHLAERYATTTVNGYIRVMRAILVDAGNVAASRVASLEEDKRTIRASPKMNRLEEDEIEAFLRVAHSRYPQHFAFILVLFTTATRMSTVRALRREDFDPKAGVVHARRRLSDAMPPSATCASSGAKPGTKPGTRVVSSPLRFPSS
jgi:integrase